ncbi:hypothetical protein PsorP6_017466 [Peronosclerospora sorghi]|uniref:Uncharacterized protein n=1 Tax=Peronosclerospora sorghi TaxID=230839 RepID=A0ACC0WMZ5_9STRA|nr:hypothetical protein PsorP6_017466 [Peronosclerospora sorghi]
MSATSTQRRRTHVYNKTLRLAGLFFCNLTLAVRTSSKDVFLANKNWTLLRLSETRQASAKVKKSLRVYLNNGTTVGDSKRSHRVDEAYFFINIATFLAFLHIKRRRAQSCP